MAILNPHERQRINRVLRESETRGLNTLQQVQQTWPSPSLLPFLIKRGGWRGIVDFKSGKREVKTGDFGKWLVVDDVEETAVFDDGQPDGTAPRPFPANKRYYEVAGLPPILNVP